MGEKRRQQGERDSRPRGPDQGATHGQQERGTGQQIENEVEESDTPAGRAMEGCERQRLHDDQRENEIDNSPIRKQRVHSLI